MLGYGIPSIHAQGLLFGHYMFPEQIFDDYDVFILRKYKRIIRNMQFETPEEVFRMGVRIGFFSELLGIFHEISINKQSIDRVPP